MIKTRVAALLMFLLINGASFAQHNVTGQFVDSTDYTPLVGVTVSLIPQGSTAPVNGAITDTAGAFYIGNIANGSYTLRATYIGYRDYARTINISGPVKLGAMRISKDITMLSNVLIEATPPPARQRGDTTEYNAGAFQTTPDATSEDLVTKMPGVTNTDGTLRVHGEEVQRVLVDGREFFGDDAVATLRNLPVDIVDKIQIFDQGSEMSRFTGFNDGTTSKVLNVVTKPNRRTGTFGTAAAGFGSNEAFDDGYYLASLSLNAFKNARRLTLLGLSNNVNQQNFSMQDLSGLSGSSGSSGAPSGGNAAAMRRGGGRMAGTSGGSAFLIGQQTGISTTHAGGINYSNEWRRVKVSGSNFLNNVENNRESTTDRTYFTSGDSALAYNEQSSRRSTSFNNRFNVRLEYEIDSMNTLVFQPRVNLQTLDNYSLTNTVTQLDSTLLGHVRTDHRDRYDVFSGSGSLDFRRRFAKRGRSLSLNGSYDANGRTGFSDVQYVITNDSLVNDTTNRITDVITNGHTISGTAAYTEPLGANGRLMLSYTPSYSNNTSDRTTYRTLNNGETQELDTALTNRFDNTFTYHRGSLSYQFNRSKLNFSVEARYQESNLLGRQTYPFESTVDRTFRALLPQGQFNYRFTQTSNLRFNYRSNMNAPRVTQLQNVIDVTNPLLLSAGNASLRPETTHNAFFRYGNTNPSNNTGFFAMLGGSFTENYIGRRTLIALVDTQLADGIVLSRGSQLTHPVNFDNAFSLRTFLTYTWSIGFIKSNLSAFTGVTYSNTPALINNARNRSDQYNLMPGLTLATNFSRTFEATLGYNATYSLLQNTLPAQPDSRYFQHTASLRVNWLPVERLVLSTNLNQQHYNNLDDAIKRSFMLWNAYTGYKLLKDRSLELRLTANDILNQNNSIAYNQTETYVEEVRTLALQRHYLVSLVYTIRSFGGRDTAAPQGDERQLPRRGGSAPAQQ